MEQSRARPKPKALPPEHVRRLEAIARVTGAVAHDLNNIIMLVNGYADLLLSRTPADDSRRADAEAVMAAGKRAAAFTDQLLTIGRRRRSRPQSLDLNAFVAERRAAIQREVGARVRPEYRLAPEAGHVRMDSAQLEFVLLELARNAAASMPQGGTVAIAAGRSGKRAFLEISDTGAGLDETARRRLFEPFNSTKPKGIAKGLGLATAWALVAEPGGDILVASEPGRGTTFLVRFPES